MSVFFFRRFSCKKKKKKCKLRKKRLKEFQARSDGSIWNILSEVLQPRSTSYALLSSFLFFLFFPSFFLSFFFLWRDEERSLYRSFCIRKSTCQAALLIVIRVLPFAVQFVAIYTFFSLRRGISSLPTHHHCASHAYFTHFTSSIPFLLTKIYSEKDFAQRKPRGAYTHQRRPNLRNYSRSNAYCFNLDITQKPFSLFNNSWLQFN